MHMALEVTSRSGNDFWRCGIKFGAEPTIVDDETLSKQFDSPAIRKKSPTVGEVLEAEKALICRAARPTDAGEAQAIAGKKPR